MSGEGVFQDASGTHPVGVCTGFLCDSHDPATTYGFPADGKTPWRFVFLDFGGSLARSMTQDLVKRFGAIYELPPKHPVIERLLSFRVHDQVGCAVSTLEASRLVMDLLHALLASKEDAPELQSDHHLVRQVHEFVQASITSQISVMDIADHVGISREHMTRVFTKHGGMSPYQYILSSKVTAACSLLHAGVLSVKEVSAKLGFENVAHFTRAFKRIMRCTPSDYRSIGVLPEERKLRAPQVASTRIS